MEIIGTDQGGRDFVLFLNCASKMHIAYEERGEARRSRGRGCRRVKRGRDRGRVGRGVAREGSTERERGDRTSCLRGL